MWQEPVFPWVLAGQEPLAAIALVCRAALDVRRQAWEGASGVWSACPPAGRHHVTMAGDPLLEHARRLWVTLARAPIAFTESAFGVAVAPRSLLCPPGWVGIVVLGSTVMATAPDGRTAEIVQRALNGLPAAAMTDLAMVRGRLTVDEVRGPASLACCDRADFRPAGSDAAVETVPADDRHVTNLLARAPSEDVDESGLAEITSPAFVVRTGSETMAAAGYRTWPESTAHISVLTAAAGRGRGLARVVAAAAVAHALDTGLVSQWRARPETSRRVALALGFHELGSQLSIRLPPAGEPSSGPRPGPRRDGSGRRR